LDQFPSAGYKGRSLTNQIAVELFLAIGQLGHPLFSSFAKGLRDDVAVLSPKGFGKLRTRDGRAELIGEPLPA